MMLFILLLGWGGVEPSQQVTGQDLDTVLERADKLLEEAKAAYEDAREKSSVPAFVDAGFKLEDARIKYIVLQEIGSPEKQKIAAERLRSVNQLAKLIHDGKVAISGAPAADPKPAEPPPPTPGEPAKSIPPAVKVDISKRVPVPDAAKLKDAEKLIKELYKEQYAKKSQADRKALGRELLAEAPKNRNDQMVYWVLCREAQDQAVQGCDLPTAMKAIDTAAELFDIDGMALRNAALAATSRTAKTPEESAGIVTASFRMIDELVENDSYDAADKLAQAMLPLAKKGGNVLVYTQMTNRAKAVADAKALYQGMKSVLETLAKTPDDPAGNSEMGKFLCFVKGNWDLGLRFVVKGSDPTLKGLAEKELTNPESASDRVFLADAWHELAGKEKSTLRKSQLLAHATVLYEEALPGASGLLRAKIEKRLSDVRTEESSSPKAKTVDLLALLDPAKDQVVGTWKKDAKGLQGGGATLARLQIPYMAPDEYDLTVVAERISGTANIIFGLSRPSGRWSVVYDSFQNNTFFAGFDSVDGKASWENPTSVQGRRLKPGKSQTFEFRVRKTGVTTMIDGEKVLSWEGDYARLALPARFSTPDPKAMMLGMWDGETRYLQIRLTSISGEGKTLR